MGSTKSLDSVQISGKQIKEKPFFDQLSLNKIYVSESGAVIQQSRKLPGSQKYALLENRMAKSEGKEILNVVILLIIENRSSKLKK